MLAHRYALQSQGVDIEGHVVRHDCDNPPCVRPTHLRIGTMQDNSDDRTARGRNGRKLNPDRVREIRAKFATGQYTKAALSREYGVHEREIFYVVTREHWKQVD